MYNEHLQDEFGNGAAAPAAFAHQDNYDIEMDRYRGNSKIDIESHSHNHPAHINAAGGGFNDAVFIDDADANSIDEQYNNRDNNELNANKALPNMGHQYARSGSVRDIDSPRDQWAANPNAPDPTKGLKCLWAIIILVIVASIAAVTTLDHSMINIFIDMDFEGTYIWNLGWNGAVFLFLNDASTTQSVQYGSAGAAELFFPIPNTMIYMKNAGYLLLGTVFLSLLCIGYILIILCSRCNTHILLYINCCCCRIPQRASVYFAFDIIKSLSWATTIYYILLGIYGLLETNFYLTQACPSGNTCWSYIVPHYGFFSLMCITFGISCCAFSKVQGLDVKFNLKSMQLYYPENLRKAESRNCSLKLERLFGCIAAIKNICILAFIMFASFRDVGLISVVFYNATESTGTNAVMYFQFQGLSNSHGVLKNSYLDTINSVAGDFLYSTETPSEDLQEKAAGFNTIASLWSYWIVLILIVNLCVFLPYIWFVILKYSSIGICKFIIVLFTFIQWLVYTIFLILYYYEYYAFFHNDAQLILEYELQQISGIDYTVIWFPDWGLIVAVVLWFFLLRLMYLTFKAM